ASVVFEQPLILAAAQNEWTSFAVQVAGPFSRPSRKPARLRVTDLSSPGRSIPFNRLYAFQLLSMPLDLNRAGYVRHTGLAVTSRATLPRALLPMPMEAGILDLAGARDPAQAPNASSRASGPVSIWFDLHIPPQTSPGQYTG